MSTPIIPIVINSAVQLTRQFNLQNVQILRPKKENFKLPSSGNVRDPQLYLSFLGTPVLVDLTFHGTTYVDENGNIFTFDDFVLETVLISLNQTKNIVKTSIQGRKGTVKEYIGMGDYILTINGIIVGGNGSYPRVDVQTLKTILCCNTAITVTSWYLQMFDINSIVIDSYDINQDEGQYSRQPFSIQASSDEEENLRGQ